MAKNSKSKVRSPSAALRAEADATIELINGALDKGNRKFGVSLRVADIVATDLKTEWTVTAGALDSEHGILELILTDPSQATAAPAPAESN